VEIDIIHILKRVIAELVIFSKSQMAKDAGQHQLAGNRRIMKGKECKPEQHNLEMEISATSDFTIKF